MLKQSSHDMYIETVFVAVIDILTSAQLSNTFSPRTSSVDFVSHFFFFFYIEIALEMDLSVWRAGTYASKNYFNVHEDMSIV